MPVLSAVHPPRRAIKSEGLKLGFIALNDCAPLVVAQEMGFFSRHGLRVTLTREVGWATIREKVLFGEIDGAHAPAGMVFAATAGIGSIAEPCLTGIVLNLHGNAIVLSQRLHRAGIRDGHTLREHLRRKREPLTFGVVYQWSSHHVLLRQWLYSHGISVETEVRIVVVPPSQVLANLRAGNLDGYCVGEPWASLAVLQKAGWVVARSAELAPFHPEKVLLVRRAFAERAREQHLALIAALHHACAYCDEPANREQIIELLARREYIGAPPQALRMSMAPSYNFGQGRVEECPGFNLFAQNDANAPTPDKARWVTDGLVQSGLVPSLPADVAEQCFRLDLFREATARPAPTLSN